MIESQRSDREWVPIKIAKKFLIPRGSWKLFYWLLRRDFGEHISDWKISEEMRKMIVGLFNIAKIESLEICGCYIISLLVFFLGIFFFLWNKYCKKFPAEKRLQPERI